LVKIAPSILSCDFANLGEEIKLVEQAGCDLLHIDVMDGRFVDNISFGPVILGAVNRITDLPLDVHLMIVEPEKQLRIFRESGADMISVHTEAVRDPVPVLKEIRSLGALAGAAINPDTAMDGVAGFLEEIDYVLVMGVYPGRSGQKFLESAAPKIRTLRRTIDERGLGVKLEVDGGINPSTVQEVAKAGVDIIVAGDAIFKSRDPGSAIRELKKLTTM
jgi:ribulose-phosphate 3-epimerase